MSPASTASNNSIDRKSTRLNSSHGYISYAVFCLEKKYRRRALQVDHHDCRSGRDPEGPPPRAAPGGPARGAFGEALFYRPDVFSVLFFNDTATTEIYTLSLHDALPI